MAAEVIPPCRAASPFRQSKLLRGVKDENKPAATPWWLSLLRLAAARLLIGLADPRWGHAPN